MTPSEEANTRERLSQGAELFSAENENSTEHTNKKWELRAVSISAA